MSTVARRMSATPAQVFATLSDGWRYSNWVVGTSHMRAVEQDWPAVGSKLFHASGAWPVVVRDETEVVGVEPDRRLAMTARARPAGEASVEITMVPDGDGSLVTLTEEPVRGPGKWLHNPAAEFLLHRRNVETLARLAAIVENHTSPRG